jgi:hypothetical protein
MRQHRAPKCWLHYLLIAAAMGGGPMMLIAGQQSQPTQGRQGQQQDQNAQAGPRSSGVGGQRENQVLGPGSEVWGVSNLAEIPGTPWRIMPRTGLSPVSCSQETGQAHRHLMPA